MKAESGLEKMNLENKENIILTHSDTDGVCSAILLERMLKKNQVDIEFPEKFGNYQKAEVRKETEAWMTDMRPTDGNFEGTVIDHHEGHFKERKYKLMLDLKLCTTELLFSIYKQQIEKKDSWLVVLGAIGDFAIQYLENELIDEWNELFEPIIKRDENQRFKFFLPLGSRMSALINSGFRAGKAKETLNIIRNLKEPFSILKEKRLEDSRQVINKAVHAVMNANDIVELHKGILFFQFSSEYKIGGRIASQLAADNNSTIAYNSHFRKISIRGVLSNYIASKLIGCEVGGHPVAMAGNVTDEFAFRNSIFENIGEMK